MEKGVQMNEFDSDLFGNCDDSVGFSLKLLFSSNLIGEIGGISEDASRMLNFGLGSLEIFGDCSHAFNGIKGMSSCSL